MTIENTRISWWLYDLLRKDDREKGMSTLKSQLDKEPK